MRAARGISAPGPLAILAALACLLAALACAAALLAPAAAPAQDRASLPDIEDEVMCPICGTLLELSESPQAERERNLIRRLIAEGRSKEEIRDALVAEYGPDVLATPEGEGFDLAAWVVPGAAGIAALVAVVWILTQGRSRRLGEDEPAPISAADADRLRRDMSRHEDL